MGQKELRVEMKREVLSAGYRGAQLEDADIKNVRLDEKGMRRVRRPVEDGTSILFATIAV